MDQQNGKKRRKAAFITALVIFLIVLAGSIYYFATHGWDLFALFHRGSADTAEGAETFKPVVTSAAIDSETDTPETEPPLPQNPVNFSAQMKINDEIYAWLYIPNTNVNYPILQSKVDDLYYLRRDVHENYDISGVLFTQSVNNRNFKDPVTVIYGHNMTEYGTMFATLHNFEDAEFFENNDTFYIYTPGHILTYKIVSAYKYDNRHIMNSFNFDDPEVRREYFDYVLSPMAIPMNVREGAEIKDDDRLVVLSTCMTDNTYRFLVNGVLVKDEITK